jgi:hypothetical protein
MPPSNYLYLFTDVLGDGVTSLARGIIVRRDIVLARTTRRRTERRLINDISIGIGDRENIMK